MEYNSQKKTNPTIHSFRLVIVSNLYYYFIVQVIMDRKKILITGGTGLVGSAIKHISKTFNEHLFEFVFLSSTNYNLCSLEDTIQMFTKHRPHYVIHLAANVGGLYKNMTQKVEMLDH